VRPADVPAVGASWTLDDGDWLWAETVGGLQHEAQLALGNPGSRGAGINRDIRVRGAAGEIAVARMIGVMPQVRSEPSPSSEADIDTPRGTRIEVKTGLPLVWRRTLQPSSWYVVGRLDGRTFTVTHVASGAWIAAAGMEPPVAWCPRPGTAEQNWVVP
jgi:hypothetical protein